MKYWVESTWESWTPFPPTIEEVHATGKTRGADNAIQEKIQESINQNLFTLDPHPEDYLKRNRDGTVSLGFYQTDKTKAQQWVEWRQQNLSPGQMQCVLVEIPEPGEDISLTVYGYVC